MLNPLVRFRERRIARIEQQVKRLNDQIERAWTHAIEFRESDPVLGRAYAQYVSDLEEERERLWFKRSDLLQKVPPQYDYEGDKHP
jgi:hypothetical protein